MTAWPLPCFSAMPTASFSDTFALLSVASSRAASAAWVAVTAQPMATTATSAVAVFFISVSPRLLLWTRLKRPRPPRVPRAANWAVRSLDIQRALRLQQTPINTEVPDRMLRLSEGLVQARQVVVRIAEVRILRERLLICRDRLLVARGILQHDTEVEKQCRVRLAFAYRFTVHPLRFFQAPGLVEEPTEVYPCPNMSGIERTAALISLESRDHIAFFRRQPALKPRVCVDGTRRRIRALDFRKIDA